MKGEFTLVAGIIACLWMLVLVPQATATTSQWLGYEIAKVLFSF